MKIVIEKLLLSEKIRCQCVTCKTSTLHCLTKSKDAYLCACGTEITVELKEEENENQSY